MRDNFDELTYDELVTKRTELKVKLEKLRYKNIMDYLGNKMEIRIIRRKVARLNTIIHEMDLGIRKSVTG